MSKWIRLITNWTPWMSSNSRRRFDDHGIFSSESPSILLRTGNESNKNQIGKPGNTESKEVSASHLDCPSTAEGGCCHVTLIGTSHFSPKSYEEVQRLIRDLKPEVIFLELCPDRELLINHEYSKRPSWHFSVGRYQSSYFMKSQYGRPRSEFLAAAEEASKYGGEVVLGDRPVNITHRRILAALGIWKRIKYLYKFYPSELLLPNFFLQKLIRKNMCVTIDNVYKEFPTLITIIIDERDQYMAMTLLNTAKTHASVVAVVGNGHVAGIQKYWQKPLDFERLLETPKKTVSAVKVVACLHGLVVGASTILGFGFTIPFYVSLSLPYFLRMHDVIVMAR